MKTRRIIKSIICTVFIAIFAVGCGTTKPEIATEPETETILTTEADVETEAVTEETESTESEQMTEMEQESETEKEDSDATICEKPQPYGIYTEGDHTLRFVYTGTEPKKGDEIDGQEITQVLEYWDYGNQWEGMEECRDKIDVIIFDASFASIRPENTASWFEGCAVKEIRGLENLYTGEVVNMNRMFCNCDNLTDLDLSSFETWKVMDTSEMFAGCKNLSTLNLSGWDMPSLVNMDKMFLECKNLKYIDMSKLDAADNVERMGLSDGISANEMFADCGALETILADKDWCDDIAQNEDMFRGCTSLSGGCKWDADQTGSSMAKREDGYFTPYYLTDDYLERAVCNAADSVEELLEKLDLDINNPIYECRYQDAYSYIYKNDDVFLIFEGVIPSNEAVLYPVYFLMPGNPLSEVILKEWHVPENYVGEMTYGVIPKNNPEDLFSISWSSVQEGDEFKWMISDDWNKEREAAIAEEDANGAVWTWEDESTGRIKRKVRSIGKHYRKTDTGMQLSLRVQYTFWGNEKVKERYTYFYPDFWGSSASGITAIYDKQGRPVYTDSYVSHGSENEFWIYEKGNSVYYFWLDTGGNEPCGIIRSN